MVAYFVNVAHSFLAAAFIVGLLAARPAELERGRFAVLGAWCVALGLAVGWATFAIALQNRGVVEARTSLRLAGMAAALCVFAALVLGRRIETLPASLAVNFGQDKYAIEDAAQRIAVSYPLLVDPLNIARTRYSVISAPTSFLIDAQGVIRERIDGTLSGKALEQRINRLL